MGKGYFVIRTFVSGVIGEKIKYWVPGEKPSKSQRSIRSSIKQQERNEANAVRRVARQIHANFGTGDSLLTPSYSEDGIKRLAEGIDPNAEDREDRIFEAARHDMRLWIRRTQRACAAAGVPLRYIAVTSDMDEKTGESVRVHHHVIVNAEAAEIARKKWKGGEVHEERLFDEADRTRLAGYLLNQVRRLPDEKKYIPSRNLVTPQPVDRIARSGAELKVPQGGQLLYRGPYMPGMPQYIRYVVPEIGKIRRAQKKKTATGCGGGLAAKKYA